LSVLSNAEFHTITNQESRDYCVIAAYNTGAGNVTKTFSHDRATAISTINSMDPPILFQDLRTKLPLDETRQYVVKVAGYRKQFVTASDPVSAQ
jgi:membrane-bound lytic murein transglycosylase C